jgi:hypothetical protein
VNVHVIVGGDDPLIGGQRHGGLLLVFLGWDVEARL